MNIKFMGYSKGRAYYVTLKAKRYSERLYRRAMVLLRRQALREVGSYDFVQCDYNDGKWKTIFIK